MEDSFNTRLLVFSAPLEEATFVSLPYVEELLTLSEWKEESSSTFSFSSGSPSFIVRDRLERDRKAEEEILFYSQLGKQTDASSPLEGTSSPQTTVNENAVQPKTAKSKEISAVCPIVPLRRSSNVRVAEEIQHALACGLARALGLHVPPPPDGRGSDDAPEYVREECRESLRQLIVIEWFEDLLQFIRRHGFSVIQARCVLLDGLGMLNRISGISPNATEEEAEEAMSSLLEDTLVCQTCAVPTTVVGRQVKREEVRRTVPDPEVVKALERRMKEEKLNKKQLQALQTQLDEAPLVEEVLMVDHVEEERKEVRVGPYFSLPQTAVVLDYLCGSCASHWRLWAAVLEGGEKECVSVEEYESVLLVEDTPSFCIPPLSEFLPEESHNLELSRNLLWQEAESAYTNTYRLFITSLEEMEAEKNSDLARVMEWMESRDRQNRQNALESFEYDSVEKAFTLRLNALMEKNKSIGTFARKLHPETAEEDGGAPPSPSSTPLQSNATKGKKSTTGKSSTVLDVPNPDTIVLSDTTEFHLDTVQQRLERVENALEEQREARQKRKR